MTTDHVGSFRTRSRRWRRAALAALLLAVAVCAVPARASAAAIVPAPGCTATPLGANNASEPVALPFGPLNFFGTSIPRVFVNENGSISLDDNYGGVPTQPFEFNARKVIAAFGADVDVTGPGSNKVTYGPATFSGRRALCVLWDKVGYYNAHVNRLNRFQLLLVDRSDLAPGDFDVVFNYDGIEWEAGDQQGGISGLGGDTARVGWSNGVDWFELNGSGVAGALLDANTLTGLIHNSLNSTVPGRYVLAFHGGVAPTGRSISGTVRDTSGAPVPNAYIWACRGGGPCWTAGTDAAGHYTLGGLPNGVITVKVSASGMLPVALNPLLVTLSGSNVTGADVVMRAVRPVPSGTIVSPSHAQGPLTSVLYNQAFSLAIVCASAPSYLVNWPNGTSSSGTMTASPGSTFYSVSLTPPPGIGPAQVTITCGSSPQTFDLYIDPSGIVRTTTGIPLGGATVTLLRANTPAGPFLQVPNGSLIMSPSNRTNPAVTIGNGAFAWDVISGYYVVHAERPGCYAPGNPSTPHVETPVLAVPPPQLNLVLELECPGVTAGSVSGTVPATLALTLGTPATFGAFVPGVAKDYTASMAANVVSTAGNAQLAVSDPLAANAGHLVNGAFALPAVLRAQGASTVGTGAGPNPVSAAGAPLVSYNAPVSNDTAALTFLQTINANDALRTGTYGKVLTFTLSTTAP